LSSCERLRRPLAPGPEHIVSVGPLQAACLWNAGKGVCTVLTLLLHANTPGLNGAPRRAQVPQVLGKLQPSLSVLSAVGFLLGGRLL